MVHVVVEKLFAVPLTDEEHARIGRRIDECAKMRKATWLRSYLSMDRLRMVCEFEAPDAESVREAYRSAEVAFERVWPAEVYQK